VCLVLDELRPILEGRLYTWSKYTTQAPAAPVSNYEHAIGKQGYKQSPQETWVIRWQHVLHEIKEVERILANLSPQQRKLVEMRYQKRQTWDEIAEVLNISQRQAFRVRDEVLSIFAYEYGMLNTGPRYGQEQAIHV
jgi:DNA-directed RNA polymerase specialized sigma subunit